MFLPRMHKLTELLNHARAELLGLALWFDFYQRPHKVVKQFYLTSISVQS